MANRFKNYIPISIFAFCGWGFLLGILISVNILYQADILRYVMDSLLFMLYSSLFFILLGAIIGLVIGTGISILSRIPGFDVAEERLANFYIWSIVTSAILFEILLFYFVIFRPINLKSFYTILSELIILIISSIAGAGILRIIKMTNKKGRELLIRFNLILIPLLSVCVVIILLFNNSTKAFSNISRKEKVTVKETGIKVLLIGMDGATWTLMYPLIKEGKIPNIEKLIVNGSRGNLESYVSPINPFENTAGVGMFSTAMWTSIATGKIPRTIGIQDLVLTEIPGMKNILPFRLPFIGDYLQLDGFKSFHVKAKRIWNILNNYNKKVGVYGWWGTWPAEKVKGIMVAETFSSEWPGSFYPPSISERLYELQKEMIEKFDKKWREDLVDYEQYKGFKISEEFERKLGFEKYNQNYAVEAVKGDFHKDIFFSSVCTDFYEKISADFTALYFIGPDNVEHLFWKYFDTKNFPEVDKEDVKKFGKIIENYYIFIDKAIGRLMERVDENTIIIIVSDHGMGPWIKGPLDTFIGKIATRYVFNSANHRKNGIVIISGKNINKGYEIKKANLFDVTPTILYLMGLPVGRDMDGKVLIDAIDKEFLKKYPLEYISSYETLVKKEIINVESRRDRETVERFRALGYFN